MLEKLDTVDSLEHFDAYSPKHLAEWKRSDTLVGSFSQYLCDHHYNLLCENRPALAFHYERLPDIADADRAAVTDTQAPIETTPTE